MILWRYNDNLWVRSTKRLTVQLKKRPTFSYFCKKIMIVRIQERFLQTAILEEDVRTLIYIGKTENDDVQSDCMSAVHGARRSQSTLNVYFFISDHKIMSVVWKLNADGKKNRSIIWKREHPQLASKYAWVRTCFEACFNMVISRAGTVIDLYIV